MGRTLFEFLLQVQGFPLKKSEEILTGRLGPDFEQRQEEAKWSVLKYHYDHNPSYRSKMPGGRFPDTWDEVPLMTKQDYQHGVDHWLSQPYRGKNNYISNTSGSSGHPFFFAKDKMCHALTWALVKQRYDGVGIKLDDLQGRFYGIPLEARGLVLEKLKDKVMHRVRFPVFDLSDKSLDNILEKIVRLKVVYLYGYTSAIVLFARYLIRNEITLKNESSSLKLCIVTSEVLTSMDRKILETAFGIPVINEYGSSELGIMAFEGPDGTMRGSDELIFFETIDDGHDREELVCTSLFNMAFPIIRYRIGDIVRIEKEHGRTVFHEIKGRTNDIIRLPSGKLAAGLTFYYVSRSVLEATGALKEFIIIQRSPSEFEFRISADRLLSSVEEELIREKTALYLEPGLRISFKYESRISRPASGKIKHFYSVME